MNPGRVDQQPLLCFKMHARHQLRSFGLSPRSPCVHGRYWHRAKAMVGLLLLAISHDVPGPVLAGLGCLWPGSRCCSVCALHLSGWPLCRVQGRAAAATALTWPPWHSLRPPIHLPRRASGHAPMPAMSGSTGPSHNGDGDASLPRLAPLANAGEPRSGPATTFQVFRTKAPCLVICAHVLVLPPSIRATLY